MAIGLGQRGQRRLEVLEQRRDIAELDIVDGALDRAAGVVPEHDNRLGALDLGCIFEAADNIRVDDVAGDARAEHIADAQVENQFGRNAGIDAADNGGERCLAARLSV